MFTTTIKIVTQVRGIIPYHIFWVTIYVPFIWNSVYSIDNTLTIYIIISTKLLFDTDLNRGLYILNRKLTNALTESIFMPWSFKIAVFFEANGESMHQIERPRRFVFVRPRSMTESYLLGLNIE